MSRLSPRMARAALVASATHLTISNVDNAVEQLIRVDRGKGITEQAKRR